MVWGIAAGKQESWEEKIPNLLFFIALRISIAADGTGLIQ